MGGADETTQQLYECNDGNDEKNNTPTTTTNSSTNTEMSGSNTAMIDGDHAMILALVSLGIVSVQCQRAMDDVMKESILLPCLTIVAINSIVYTSLLRSLFSLSNANFF